MKQQNIDELRKQLDSLRAESNRVFYLWKDGVVDERLAEAYREYDEDIARIAVKIIDIIDPLE